jgi:hypothetical protein
VRGDGVFVAHARGPRRSELSYELRSELSYELPLGSPELRLGLGPQTPLGLELETLTGIVIRWLANCSALNYLTEQWG